MTPIRRLLRDWRDSGALHTRVGVQSALDRYTFLTKSGALLTVLEVQGRDPECLDQSELENLSRRLEAAFRTFDERYRLNQYLLKTELPHLPQEDSDGRVGALLLEERRQYLEKKRPLYRIATYLVVAYEPGASQSGKSTVASRLQDAVALRLSTQARARAMRRQLERDSQTLAEKVAGFIAQVETVARLQALPVQKAFEVLFALLNYAPHKRESAKLTDGRYVDFQLTQSALECHRDHLRLDDDYVRVLTLKELPPKTSAYQLQTLLAVPCPCIIVSEWKRETNVAMRRRIASIRRHFHNSKTSLMSHFNSSAHSSDLLVDDSAVAMVEDLGASLESCEAKGQSFGSLSLSIVLYDKNREKLRKAVTEVTKQATALDAQLTDERYNLLNAWLATQPGNAAFNLRRRWLLETNYADWTLFGTPDQGTVTNAHLQREHLAVFETEHGVPYFYNFHVGDVGHTAVFGETGSGKSFLLNFLITHALKYDPYIYVLDLGGSYKTLTHFCGGSYLHLGEGQKFTINPFALPPTPGNLQFLYSFVKVLIESGDFRLTTADEMDVYEQIKNLYAVEPAQRRLLTLSNILGRECRQRLQRWTEGGQYGWLFDHAEDHLTLARFQVFDFEGLDRYPQVLEPLLFYVLHRASDVVADETLTTTFKTFFIDEAWRFFRHPAIKLYVTEALKTWRRKNAAMILATQSTEDLVRTEMLPTVSESCLTKLFLANRGMDSTVAREILRLNETEAALVEGLTPKSQVLIKRPNGSKVVSLSVDPKAHGLYTMSPHDFEERRQTLAQHGINEGIDILTGSQL